MIISNLWQIQTTRHKNKKLIFKFSGLIDTMSIPEVTVVVALLLVGLAVSPSQQAGEEHLEVAFKDITLKDVCANRQVPIIHIDIVKRLIREVKENPDACPMSYLASFYEIEPILNTKNELLCSEKKFNQIAEYHFRYINPKQETYKTGDDLVHLNKKIVNQPLHEEKFDETIQLDDYKQEIMIPISLQQFFKAWALQVSGLCKKSLVDNLPRAVDNNLNDGDIDLIDELAKPGAENPVTKKQIEQLSFHGIVYMPELEGELEAGDEELRKQTTILDLRKEPKLDKFMHSCKQRFEPIYSKLVIPIIRLAKLGYDYVGPHIDGIRDKLNQDPMVTKWLTLTAICEAHGNYELVESAENPIKLDKIDYDPTISYNIGDNMWIKGAEALRKEFDRISNHRSTGFKKFMFKAGVGGRKAVAVLDPHQFAWYRRNQNTLSSALNSMSIISNIASMMTSFGVFGR